MGEFFKGWRRKLGCVTLVLACMFLCGWVRSYFTDTRFDLPIGDKYEFTIRFVPDGIRYSLWENIDYLDVPDSILVDVGVIPWSVTMPLTVLAAFFLLAKPRQSAAKKSEINIPAGGT